MTTEWDDVLNENALDVGAGVVAAARDGETPRHRRIGAGLMVRREKSK